MTGWIIFGAVLLLLLALLLVPVVFRAEYRGDWTVSASYLFFRFPLYPPRAKQKPEKKGRAEGAAGDQIKKKTGERPFTETVDMLLDLVSSAGGGLRMIFRNFLVYSLKLRVDVGRGDAAETGIQYGKLCAYLYSAYAVLRHYIRFRRADLDIRPDFLAEEDRWELSLKARLTPLIVLAAALRMGASFVWKQAAGRKDGPPGAPEAKKEETGAAAARERSEQEVP